MTTSALGKVKYKLSAYTTLTYKSGTNADFTFTVSVNCSLSLSATDADTSKYCAPISGSAPFYPCLVAQLTNYFTKSGTCTDVHYELFEFDSAFKNYYAVTDLNRG